MCTPAIAQSASRPTVLIILHLQRLKNGKPSQCLHDPSSPARAPPNATCWSQLRTASEEIWGPIQGEVLFLVLCLVSECLLQRHLQFSCKVWECTWWAKSFPVTPWRHESPPLLNPRHPSHLQKRESKGNISLQRGVNSLSLSLFLFVPLPNLVSLNTINSLSILH